MTKKIDSTTLRLRVFAGPNGSGKSTVIGKVKTHKSNGRNIDFGYYVNADDIAVALRKNGFSFNDFGITVTKEAFKGVVMASGLINKEFTEETFDSSYDIQENKIVLTDVSADERLAQIIADFLRKKLLAEKKRFSFETVFSHPSKLDIMMQAAEAGYKVYLYFVSTEAPEINIYRVALRKKQGGHDVPQEKIRDRYYRSLELLYDACQLSYQVFFFDNSGDKKPFKMFANFKKSGSEKKWEIQPEQEIPNWFKMYYSAKIPQPVSPKESQPPSGAA